MQSRDSSGEIRRRRRDTSIDLYCFAQGAALVTFRNHTHLKFGGMAWRDDPGLTDNSDHRDLRWIMADIDVAIIGGGPAGLCAGLYASRANLKAVLFEKGQPGGELLNTDMIENFPGFEEIKGPKLAELFKNHALKFGLEIRQEEILEIHPNETIKKIKGSRGEYTAKVVILASGGEPKKLGIAGEKEYAGKGVSYCAVCDGFFFKDRVISVVGGGNSAVEEGTFLAQLGSKVYIIHRRNELRADKIIQERAFKNPKIEFIWDTVVEEAKGSQFLETLVLKNVKTGETREHATDALFVFVGFVPKTGILKADVKYDAGGHIITNERMETGIPGLYAVGDVRSQLVRQVTNALADGTVAAVAADKYIQSLD